MKGTIYEFPLQDCGYLERECDYSSKISTDEKIPECLKGRRRRKTKA